ncbi:AMP-binding protein [Paraburkholderia sp.]|uniref:AMP-binding protein n=1 Tax=Paraburkholderia sp. TaxID=1926495 RepID=UPI0039E41397
MKRAKPLALTTSRLLLALPEFASRSGANSGLCRRRRLIRLFHRPCATTHSCRRDECIVTPSPVRPPSTGGKAARSQRAGCSQCLLFEFDLGFKNQSTLNRRDILMTTMTPLTPLYPKDLWTLPALLERQARERGDAPFLQWTDEGAPLSFFDVNARSNQIAHGLHEFGIRKGERVVFLLGNSLSHVYCWFACTKLGAVDAPINESLMGSLLTHQMNLCRANVAIVDERLVERIVPVREELLYLKRLIVIGDPTSARMLLPECEVVSLDAIASERIDNPPYMVTPADPSTIMFTSGTTGPSKGVLLPHGALHFNAEQIVALYGLTADDVFMSPFPLFHGSGRQNSLYPMLLVGGRCTLYPKFSGTRFLERAARSRATITMFHGSMLQMIADQSPSPADRAHRLRAAICIPMPYTLQDAFQQRFGIAELKEAIGMTETSLPIIPPPGRKPPKGYAGCLIGDWYDARVADPETDEEVPDGTMGELLIRPKFPWTMMIAYENMPAETASANRNYWFHTGDGVRRDADGWYGFADRIKDSIRRRGENISSFEVEYQLLMHPSISECAVVSVRVDAVSRDEEVKACIVCKEGMQLEPVELIAWCETRLPHFAVPRYVEFVTELPKTPTGKTQKNKLRANPLNETTWDRLGC